MSACACSGHTSDNIGGKEQEYYLLKQIICWKIWIVVVYKWWVEKICWSYYYSNVSILAFFFGGGFLLIFVFSFQIYLFFIF